MFSHELRTPLASILGYVEILREEGMTGPDAEHCAEVIERNAQRLLRLRIGGIGQMDGLDGDAARNHRIPRLVYGAHGTAAGTVSPLSNV